jgi:hypothetical protein
LEWTPRPARCWKTKRKAPIQTRSQGIDRLTHLAVAKSSIRIPEQGRVGSHGLNLMRYQ